MNLRQVAIWLALVSLVCLSLGAFLLNDSFAMIYRRHNTAGTNFSDQKAVPLGTATAIEISCNSPGVTVVPASGADVVAKVSGYFSSEPEFIVQSLGSTVRIDLRFKPGALMVRNANMEVFVPQDYTGSIKIDVASGSVSVRDFNLAHLDIRAVSGSVKCESVSARSAFIKVTSGSLNVVTHSGDIVVESISGSVTVGLKTLGEKVAVKANSGSVSVSLPKDSAFRLSAYANSGSVSCSYPIAPTRSGRNFVEGTAGQSPKSTVQIDANSGSINVRSL